MNRAHRFRGDEGSVIVQAAITMPIVFLMLFSIVEYGLIFRDYLAVSDTVNDGARTGAIVGSKTTSTGKNGDYLTVETLRQGFGGIPPTWIKKIVIFKGASSGAGSPISQVPSVCKNGTASSQGNSCNVYDPYQAFFQAQQGNANYFKCVAGAGISCGWNPSTRKDGTGAGSTTANPIIDYFGVYVRLDRQYMTKLFGNTFTLEVAAIQRLEPGFLDT